MNTNNKEALELLEDVAKWYGFDEFESENRMNLRKALSLLQDNEVQESTCLCKEDNCPNCEYVGCNHVKPSSKVEKLKELEKGIELGDFTTKGALSVLIEILIEDEE